MSHALNPDSCRGYVWDEKLGVFKLGPGAPRPQAAAAPPRPRPGEGLPQLEERQISTPRTARVRRPDRMGLRDERYDLYQPVLPSVGAFSLNDRDTRLEAALSLQTELKSRLQQAEARAEELELELRGHQEASQQQVASAVANAQKSGVYDEIGPHVAHVVESKMATALDSALSSVVGKIQVGLSEDLRRAASRCAKDGRNALQEDLQRTREMHDVLAARFNEALSHLAERQTIVLDAGMQQQVTDACSKGAREVGVELKAAVLPSINDLHKFLADKSTAATDTLEIVRHQRGKIRGDVDEVVNTGCSKLAEFVKKQVSVSHERSVAALQQSISQSRAETQVSISEMGGGVDAALSKQLAGLRQQLQEDRTRDLLPVGKRVDSLTEKTEGIALALSAMQGEIQAGFRHVQAAVEKVLEDKVQRLSASVAEKVKKYGDTTTGGLSRIETLLRDGASAGDERIPHQGQEAPTPAGSPRAASALMGVVERRLASVEEACQTMQGLLSAVQPAGLAAEERVIEALTRLEQRAAERREARDPDPEPAVGQQESGAIDRLLNAVADAEERLLSAVVASVATTQVPLDESVESRRNSEYGRTPDHLACTIRDIQTALEENSASCRGIKDLEYGMEDVQSKLQEVLERMERQQASGGHEGAAPATEEKAITGVCVKTLKATLGEKLVPALQEALQAFRTEAFADTKPAHSEHVDERFMVLPGETRTSREDVVNLLADSIWNDVDSSLGGTGAVAQGFVRSETGSRDGGSSPSPPRFRVPNKQQAQEVWANMEEHFGTAEANAAVTTVTPWLPVASPPERSPSGEGGPVTAEAIAYLLADVLDSRMEPAVGMVMEMVDRRLEQLWDGMEGRLDPAVETAAERVVEHLREAPEADPALVEMVHRLEAATMALEQRSRGEGTTSSEAAIQDPSKAAQALAELQVEATWEQIKMEQEAEARVQEARQAAAGEEAKLAYEALAQVQVQSVWEILQLQEEAEARTGEAAQQVLDLQGQVEVLQLRLQHAPVAAMGSRSDEGAGNLEASKDRAPLAAESGAPVAPAHAPPSAGEDGEAAHRAVATTANEDGEAQGGLERGLAAPTADGKEATLENQGEDDHIVEDISEIEEDWELESAAEEDDDREDAEEQGQTGQEATLGGVPSAPREDEAEAPAEGDAPDPDLPPPAAPSGDGDLADPEQALVPATEQLASGEGAAGPAVQWHRTAAVAVEQLKAVVALLVTSMEGAPNRDEILTEQRSQAAEIERIMSVCVAELKEWASEQKMSYNEIIRSSSSRPRSQDESQRKSGVGDVAIQLMKVEEAVKKLSGRVQLALGDSDQDSEPASVLRHSTLI